MGEKMVRCLPNLSPENMAPKSFNMISLPYIYQKQDYQSLTFAGIDDCLW
jgi:hypothetical protein